MGKRVVTGHQPSYLPWLGLLHKASLGDVFVFMDDVQFTKDDFIHRNRIKTLQGQALMLTIPVDLKHSASDKIKDVLIDRHSQQQKNWQEKHWTSIRFNYSRAPYFKEYKDFFESVYLGRQWEKLADLDLTILKQAFDWFDIRAELAIGSEQGFTRKKSDLILEHAQRFKAELVVTGAMGADYIEKEKFEAQGIGVYHQAYAHPVYSQLGGEFTPNLCFLDLLFNHGPEAKAIFKQGNIRKEELV